MQRLLAILCGVAMFLGLQLCDAAVAEAPAWVADRPKHLLLDTLVVAETKGCTLELGTVLKHPANPLMVEDEPWELRYDNLYASVAYDTQAKEYVCWYNPFIRWGAVEAVKRGEEKKEDLWKIHLAGKYKGWETVLMRAVSKDGLKWEKPNVGLYSYKGSKENNVVAPIEGPTLHGAGVFLDSREDDPARRFKLFSRISGPRVLGTAFSADGIRFTPAAPGVPAMKIHGDTHNNAFWAPTLGKYVGISRMIDANYGGRVVLRTESDDFQTWTVPEMVLCGDAARQTYAMLPCYDSGLYLAMLMMYEKADDRTFCELAWSRDTKVWHRVQPGKSLIPNGAKEGDYDWGCVYAAAPLVQDDGIRIYYGGSNGRHFGWREGCLALATLGRDRWAGYRASDPQTPAAVTTNPVACRGPRLTVTADSLGDGSEVRVSVLDPATQGKVLFTSEPVPLGGTHASVTFPDGRTLAEYAGKPIVFRFELRNAKLFSFGFASSGEAPR